MAATDYSSGGLAFLQLGLGFLQADNERAMGAYQQRMMDFQCTNGREAS